MDEKVLLNRVAAIICEETCGLTSECKSREAAKALLDKGLLASAKVLHVVMGNDFPAAVFDTLAAAEAYCEKMRATDKLQPKGMHRYIHWRTYDFFLNDERPATDVGRI